MSQWNDLLMGPDTLLGKKLEDHTHSGASGKTIADKIAGTSEETAELFSSRYTPARLNAGEIGGDAPDGVSIRFAVR